MTGLDVTCSGAPGARRRAIATTLALAMVAAVASLVLAAGPASADAASASLVAVSAGYHHSCGLTAAGGVKCWGQNDHGQLGDGSTNPSATPVDVTGLSSGVIAVSAGQFHSCALTTGGAVRCWGFNSDGQLGNGTTTDSTTPVSTTGLSSGVASVSAGGHHTCALTTAGGAKCWGNNVDGMVGDGTNTKRTTPVGVSGLASGVTSISAGLYHSCASTSSGSAKCWGWNGFGQLGNGTTSPSYAPATVSGLSSGISSVSAGQFHSCALTTSGSVKCWGYNSDGQLGNGTLASSTTPVDVSSLSSVIAVSAGGHHTCARTSSGGAKCWGNNVDGMVGDGTNTRRTTPVDVVGLTSGVRTVSAGLYHSCAATTTGTLKCWGYNGSGRVGDGSTSSSSSPVAVLGGATYAVSSVAPLAADKALTAPRGIGSHVVLTASDADGDVPTFSVVDEPNKGVLDCNGTYGEDCVYTAGPGQTGADSFTYRANDGTVDSNTATVSITITNQAPVADAASTSAPRGVATEIVLTGSDPNSDPITFAVAATPAKGTVSCSAGGICSYTATPGTTGTDSFSFTTSDGTLSSTPAAVTVTITNQAPVADPRSLDAGRGVATPVVLSGVDPNGDTLSFSLVDQPAKGSVSCTGADCTYTSALSATGTDSFTYRANDGDDASAPVTVSINLVNAGPTANGQAVSSPRGVATPIVLSGADPEGDGLDFAVTSQPTKGVLSCVGADCSYTAGAGQTGADSFTFTTFDGAATSSEATVSITITNQAPVANGQTIAGNAPGTGTPITLTGSDPNGDTLTYATTSSPAKGLVSCTASACVYTAASGKTGTDSFGFAVTDIGGLTSTATVTINLDGTTPGVYLGQVDYVEPESGNGTYRSPFIPVTLTTASASPVTIWYHTVDGTAITTGLGGDYRQSGTASSPQSITIAAGKTTGWIQPPVFDDNLVEGTEHFDVVVTSLTGGASYLGGSATTRVNIIDADSSSVGKPILSVLDASQAEGNVGGGRTVGFRVMLSKAAPSPVTVTCTPVAGTATSPADFKAGARTVTIPAGGLSQTVDIAVNANAIAQPSRSFSLTCNPTGADLTVLQATATATLVDED